MVRHDRGKSPRDEAGGPITTRYGKDRGHGMNVRRRLRRPGVPDLDLAQLHTRIGQADVDDHHRLLFEGGYSFKQGGVQHRHRPGINQERGTAAWYADASRRDLSLARTMPRSTQTRATIRPYNLQGPVRSPRCAPPEGGRAVERRGPWRLLPVGIVALVLVRARHSACPDSGRAGLRPHTTQPSRAPD